MPAPPTIDDRLKLIIPIYDRQDQIKAYVHSTPVSRQIFEANFALISKTFAAITGEGLGNLAGPRVAALVMKEVAKRMVGEKDAPLLVNPLLSEIKRTGMVLLRTSSQWEFMPLQDALDQNYIDEDDGSEVENALVFFIAYSAMHRRKLLAEILPGAAQLWGALTSSLNVTEFRASLATSTQDASTKKATVGDIVEALDARIELPVAPPQPAKPQGRVQIVGRPAGSSLPT